MNLNNQNIFINNNSLYNIFKYPQISILIPNIENWKTDNLSIINIINLFLVFERVYYYGNKDIF